MVPGGSGVHTVDVQGHQSEAKQPDKLVCLVGLEYLGALCSWREEWIYNEVRDAVPRWYMYCILISKLYGKKTIYTDEITLPAGPP